MQTSYYSDRIIIATEIARQELEIEPKLMLLLDSVRREAAENPAKVIRLELDVRAAAE